jgi:hypothetical protein
MKTPTRRSAPDRKPWTTREHIAYVNRVARWLAKAGVRGKARRTRVAIDLVDGLFAAAMLKSSLDSMLRCDPTTSAGRQRALSYSYRISTWAHDELQERLARLASEWEPSIVRTIARRPRSVKKRAAAG